MTRKTTSISQKIDIDGQEYSYRIRRSRRAKQLLLHVDARRGIEVVIPWYVSLRQGERFIRDRRRWIGQVLNKQQLVLAKLPQRRFVTGESVPYLGQQIPLVITTSPTRRRTRTTHSDGKLNIVLPSTGSVRTALVAWYREQAKQYFTSVTAQLAAQDQLTITKIAIGEQRTQWGSCSARGRLSFNWRLVLGPAEIARYVAVHEVMHLRYHNHSAQFWQAVARHDPEFKSHRRWLKLSGQLLFL